MGIPEWIAIVSVLVALITVIIQQRLSLQQARTDARARQYDRTTALLFKALDNPDLLEAISGNSEDDQRQRRFRQIWVNHAQMVFRQRHLFGAFEWESTVRDMSEFMSMPEIKCHWDSHQDYYASDFREFMSNRVYTCENEAPQAGASSGENEGNPQSSTT